MEQSGSYKDEVLLERWEQIVCGHLIFIWENGKKKKKENEGKTQIVMDDIKHLPPQTAEPLGCRIVILSKSGNYFGNIPLYNIVL